MVASSPSSTQGSNLASSNNEHSLREFDSYRELSGSEIFAEIQDLQSKGITYAGNENIASQCEFVYNKTIKGSTLVTKDNASEFILSGVFEIDAKNFFMTSDAKWNSNNTIGLPFHQVKPSCLLLPVERNESFSFSSNHFPTIINNLRAIENLGNPRRSRDAASVIIGDPPAIKIVHPLFIVRYIFILLVILTLTFLKEKKANSDISNNGIAKSYISYNTTLTSRRIQHQQLACFFIQ